MTTKNIGSIDFAGSYRDTLPGTVADEKSPMKKLTNFSNLVAQEKPAKANTGVKGIVTGDDITNEIKGATPAEWVENCKNMNNADIVNCIENYLNIVSDSAKGPKEISDGNSKIGIAFVELQKRAKNDAFALYSELNNEKVFDKLFKLILDIRTKEKSQNFPPFIIDNSKRFVEKFGINMANAINIRFADYNKAAKENRTSVETPFDIGMDYGRFVGALYREVIDKVSPNMPLKISWEAIKSSTEIKAEVSTSGSGSKSSSFPPLYPTLPSSAAPGATDTKSKMPDISSAASISMEIDVIKLVDSIVMQVSNKKIGQILKEVKMDKPFISIKLDKNTINEFKIGFYEGMNQYIASFVEYVKK